MARNNDINPAGLVVIGTIAFILSLPLLLYYIMVISLVVGFISLVILLLQHFLHEEWININYLLLTIIICLILATIGFFGKNYMENFIAQNELLSNLKETFKIGSN
jgi:uncharacterized protein YacL